MILEDLAVGLEHDGEGSVATGHLEQIGGFASLQPQRGAAAGTPPREEERSSRGLPEPGREEGAVGDFGEQDLFHLVGLEEDLGRAGRLIQVRESEHHAVVGPDEVDIGAVAVAEPSAGGERPRGVDPGAERGKHDDAPIADLVAISLHDERPVRWEGTGCVALVGDECGEVRGGPRIEAELVFEHAGFASSRSRAPMRRVNAPMALPTSSGRPGASPCQNGILAAATPGAGVTTTRSSVISATRHVDEPRMNVSPGRLS